MSAGRAAHCWDEAVAELLPGSLSLTLQRVVNDLTKRKLSWALTQLMMGRVICGGLWERREKNEKYERREMVGNRNIVWTIGLPDCRQSPLLHTFDFPRGKEGATGRDCKGS